ncbi:MAG: hypothetical protein M3Q55_06880 [Acidobacteriota bacterium]|nr:hypothetical protein [Acidobacteriota bacterium]
MTMLVMLVSLAAVQASEKLLIASIEPATVDNGVVSELVWDGDELVVLVAVPKASGHEARFYALPGPRVALRQLAEPPATRDEYWKRKASRVSPTGLGRITKASDAQLPMMGIGSLEQRLGNAADFGGTAQKFEVRLGDLVLHASADRVPYDGEVWAWSPAEINKIAYIDGKGDLWIAGADGSRAKRLGKGDFLLPAWSLDGRAVAVVERNAGKKRWDVFVFTVPQT